MQMTHYVDSLPNLSYFLMMRNDQCKQTLAFPSYMNTQSHAYTLEYVRFMNIRQLSSVSIDIMFSN